MNTLASSISPDAAAPDADSDWPSPAEFSLLPPSAAPPTIFQSRPYLMAYRRHFGAGKKFHKLRAAPGTKSVFSGNGDPRAHLSLSPHLRAAHFSTTFFDNERSDSDISSVCDTAFLMTRGRTLKRLEWWGAGIHDVGGAHMSTHAGAQSLWQQIEALAACHDGACLAQIDARSPLLTLAARSNWNITPAETCPVLSFPDSFSSYVASLGKNMREQIKRYPKRLEKNFAVSYEMAQSAEEVQSALDDLFTLHGKRWRARGQTGVLVLPRRQKFHRALCEDLRARDALRLWTLRCDHRAACVLLCYFHANRYFFFIGGFEPELMRWSVGTCLFARVFQHAIEEGASEFDFLRGAEEYKYRLGAIDRDYKTISTFAPSARGRLLQKRLRLEDALKQRMYGAFSSGHAARETPATPNES